MAMIAALGGGHPRFSSAAFFKPSAEARGQPQVAPAQSGLEHWNSIDFPRT
ncbi:hypothetical protein N9L68_03900 [bacterium]|nr:hypothetical protein [bacterium]